MLGIITFLGENSNGPFGKIINLETQEKESHFIDCSFYHASDFPLWSIVDYDREDVGKPFFHTKRLSLASKQDVQRLICLGKVKTLIKKDGRHFGYISSLAQPKDYYFDSRFLDNTESMETMKEDALVSFFPHYDDVRQKDQAFAVKKILPTSDLTFTDLMQKMEIWLNETIDANGFALPEKLDIYFMSFAPCIRLSKLSKVENLLESCRKGAFTVSRNFVLGGVVYPCLIFRNNSVFPTHQIPEMTKQNAEEYIREIHTYLDHGDAIGFLRSSLFRSLKPLDIGAEGIELIIRAISMFLNEDSAPKLNDFHRALIETPAENLYTLYNDKELLSLGEEDLITRMDSNKFMKVFSQVYTGNAIKNDNWHGLMDRFRVVQSNLYFYFAAICACMSAKQDIIEECVPYFFDYHIHDRIIDLLRVYCATWDMKLVPYNRNLIRKIAGSCFDFNRVDMLVLCLSCFDALENEDLVAFSQWLKHRTHLPAERLLNWCRLKNNWILGVKIINYYWHCFLEDSAETDTIIEVLGTILKENPLRFFTNMMHNESISGFGIDEKLSYLCTCYYEICDKSIDNRGALALADWIRMEAEDSEGRIRLIWEKKIIEQMYLRMTEDTAIAAAIQLIRSDNENRENLEKQYIDRFVQPRLEGIDTEEEKEALINSYREAGAEFVSVFIMQYGKKNIVDLHTFISDCIDSLKFKEALNYLYEWRNTLPREEMQAEALRVIRSVLLRGEGSEDSGTMLTGYFAVDEIEELLTKSFRDNPIMHKDEWLSLIFFYLIQNDLFKAAYLFIPFQAPVYGGQTYLPQIQTVNELFKSLGVMKLGESNYQIIVRAFQSLDVEACDQFLSWVQQFKNFEIDGKYTPGKNGDWLVRSIAKCIREGKTDYVFWQELLHRLLLADRSSIQDNQRYSVVINFLVRFGVRRFEENVYESSLNKTLLKNSKKTPDQIEQFLIPNLWKGLMNGRYPSNFLALNMRLLDDDDLPVTYWKLFYDYPCVTGHIFSAPNLMYASWYRCPFEEQIFLNKLLSLYGRTQESVLFDIAVFLMLASEEELDIQSVDTVKVFLTSPQKKTKFMQALIHMMLQQKSSEFIVSLLQFDQWSVLGEEKKLLNILRQIALDPDSILGEDRDQFSEAEKKEFLDDLLSIFLTDRVNQNLLLILERRGEEPTLYSYKLITLVLDVAYSFRNEYYFNEIWKFIKLPVISENHMCTPILRQYAALYQTVYQCDLNTMYNNEIYILNRYVRLFAIHQILCWPKEYQDTELTDLMRDRGHRKVGSLYFQMKNNLEKIAEQDKVPEWFRIWLISALIGTEWGEIICYYRNADVLDNHALLALRLMGEIVAKSNYRPLYKQILQLSLSDIQSSSSFPPAWLDFVGAIAPKCRRIIDSILSLQSQADYPDLLMLITEICQTPDHPASKIMETVKCYIYENHSVFATHLELCIDVVTALCYADTLFTRMLGFEVRSQKCDPDQLEKWRAVFIHLRLENEYHYLKALAYFMVKNKTLSKKEMQNLAGVNHFIFIEWDQEKEAFIRYLEGESSTFKPIGVKWYTDLELEGAPQDYPFIQSALKIPPRERENAKKTAVDAYRRLVKKQEIVFQTESDQTGEVIKDLRAVFSYVHSAQTLYEISEKEEFNEKREKAFSYNELAIAFGIQLIVNDNALSIREKLVIMSELCVSREKFPYSLKNDNWIVGALQSALMSIIHSRYMTLDAWIEFYDRPDTMGIRQILFSDLIGCSDLELDRLVNECAEIQSQCVSEPELFQRLQTWMSRRERRTQSIYSSCFDEAVRRRSEEIKRGVHLALRIDNKEKQIKDNAIYYTVRNLFNPDAVAPVSIGFGKGFPDASLRVFLHAGGQDVVLPPFGFYNSVIIKPGDECGQVLTLQDETVQMITGLEEKTVEVELRIMLRDRVLVRAVETLSAEHTVPTGVHTVGDRDYVIKKPVFSDNVKGFGREAELHDLEQMLINKRMAIIYGPSRVGKSSLLQYFASKKFLKKIFQPSETYPGLQSLRRISCVFVCDEAHGNDYSTITDPATADLTPGVILEQVFIRPLREAAFLDSFALNRCRMFGSDCFPDSLLQNIQAALDDVAAVKSCSTDDVIRCYERINAALEKEQTEIWLLVDEFQEIIKNWRGAADDLARFIYVLQDRIHNIRLILCGSDDMLRIYECNDNGTDRWVKLRQYTSDCNRRIDQMQPDDFSEMMQDKDIWGDVSPFASESLDLLYHYTGGSAITGKIIGQTLVARARNGQFANRSWIYPSDITSATLAVQESDKIFNILRDSTTKNLHNGEKILVWMASCFIRDKNLTTVTMESIAAFFTSMNVHEIQDELQILVARGILTKLSGLETSAYMFSTMFYLDFFQREAKKPGRIEQIEANERQDQDAASQENYDDTVKRIASEITDLGVETAAISIIKALPVRFKNTTIEHFTSNYTHIENTGGGQTNIGTEQTNIGTQINIRYHLQQMVVDSFETFSEISRLTANGKQLDAVHKERLQNAFANLPSPRAYLEMLPEENKKELSEIERKIQTLPPDSKEYEELDSQRDGILAPCVDETVSIYSRQIAYDKMQGNLPEITDKGLLWSVGLADSNVAPIRNSMPSDALRMQFDFAVEFHKLYLLHGKELGDTNEIDYCPVALMYCKFVENLMKALHTRLYVSRMPDTETDQTIGPKNRKYTVKFGEIGINNGKFEYQGSIASLQGTKLNLCLGTYAFHLAQAENFDGKNLIPIPDMVKEYGIRKLAVYENDYALGEWRTHARYLAVLHKYRNACAHSGDRITRKHFDQIVEILFKKNELNTIVSLASES